MKWKRSIARISIALVIYVVQHDSIQFQRRQPRTRSIGNIGNALRRRGPLGRGDREQEELPALVAYSIWEAQHSIDMASTAITINRAAGIYHEPTLRL
jgi:hypothetical protein